MNYTTKYPQIDLQLYSDLVDAYESTIYLHMEVINLEEKLYGLNNATANILIKTVMLRLKPEFKLNPGVYKLNIKLIRPFLI